MSALPAARFKVSADADLPMARREATAGATRDGSLIADDEIGTEILRFDITGIGMQPQPDRPWAWHANTARQHYAAGRL